MIVASDEEDYQRIHVRRSHVLKDSLRALSNPHFKDSKMLKVRFIGEQAEDEGGPRREFFRLATREAFCSSGLFVGWPDHVIPTHNVEAIASNKYYVVGKLLAMSLVQGGQPPLCFSAAVADYLVFDAVKSEPCISDIPDPSVCSVLKEVGAIAGVGCLWKLLRSQLFLFIYRWRRVLHSRS